MFTDATRTAASIEATLIPHLAIHALAGSCSALVAQLEESTCQWSRQWRPSEPPIRCHLSHKGVIRQSDWSMRSRPVCAVKILHLSDYCQQKECRRLELCACRLELESGYKRQEDISHDPRSEPGLNMNPSQLLPAWWRCAMHEGSTP